MQKVLRICIYALFCTFVVSTTAHAAPKIVFNGKVIKSDVAPLIEKGVTLVPVRVILETFGAKVDYDKASRKISVEQGSLLIHLQINNKSAYVGSKKIDLIVAPKIVSERTVVPLRFVFESMSANVQWDAKTQTVNIKYASTGILASQREQYEKALFQLVNNTRKEFGLKQFILVDELTSLARSHSEDMAANHFLDHISPNTGSPSDRGHNVGLPSIGENIAAGAFSPQTVHDAFMNSAGHRAEILNPKVNFIGVGVYLSEKSDIYAGKYFTQDFITGDAFFTGPFDNTSIDNASIVVKGYSVAASPKITVYKMVDENTMSDSYDLELNVVNNKFSQKIELKYGSGVYKLMTGSDVRKVTLK